METGTLDLEGRGVTSLPPGLFQDDRALSAVTRVKLSGNKLQVTPLSSFSSVVFFFAGLFVVSRRPTLCEPAHHGSHPLHIGQDPVFGTSGLGCRVGNDLSSTRIIHGVSLLIMLIYDRTKPLAGMKGLVAPCVDAKSVLLSPAVLCGV